MQSSTFLCTIDITFLCNITFANFFSYYSNQQLLYWQFFVTFNSYIWFWLNFGLFLGSMWGSKTVLGSTHVVERCSFSMIPWILTYEFVLILGSSLSFWGPNGLVWGVGVGFDKCFGVYSCSWTTFIFYVSFNSGIWFWLNVGVIFYFLGHNGLFWELG